LAGSGDLRDERQGCRADVGATVAVAGRHPRHMVPLVTVLASALDTGSAEYAARRAAMLAKLEELDAEHAKALAGGGPKYVKRHRDRGKPTVRERVELLIDLDSPFVELSAFARHGHGFSVGGSGVSGSVVLSCT